MKLCNMQKIVALSAFRTTPGITWSANLAARLWFLFMRQMKPLLLIAIIWFALLCALFVFTAPLAQALFILFVPLMVAVLLAGGLIAIIALATLKRAYRRGGAVVVICLIGFLLYYSNAGFVWGRYVLFQLRKPAYVQQLAEAERLGFVAEDLGHTDDGPPQRHGFYWQAFG